MLLKTLQMMLTEMKLPGCILLYQVTNFVLCFDSTTTCQFIVRYDESNGAKRSVKFDSGCRLCRRQTEELTQHSFDIDSMKDLNRHPNNNRVRPNDQWSRRSAMEDIGKLRKKESFLVAKVRDSQAQLHKSITLMKTTWN